MLITKEKQAGVVKMAEHDYTEEEISLTMIAHDCTREEAISTHCASVRAFRDKQRPILLLEELRNVRNDMPVSYTHLTLPTILRV